jgi:hypothetical protein
MYLTEIKVNWKHEVKFLRGITGGFSYYQYGVEFSGFFNIKNFLLEILLL